MDSNPQPAELIEESQRVAQILTQSGALHVQPWEPPADELPEVLYHYGGKDYRVIVTTV